MKAFPLPMSLIFEVDPKPNVCTFSVRPPSKPLSFLHPILNHTSLYILIASFFLAWYFEVRNSDGSLFPDSSLVYLVGVRLSSVPVLLPFSNFMCYFRTISKQVPSFLSALSHICRISPCDEGLRSSIEYGVYFVRSYSITAFSCKVAKRNRFFSTKTK